MKFCNLSRVVSVICLPVLLHAGYEVSAGQSTSSRNEKLVNWVCDERWTHSSFVFTGKVVGMNSYREVKLSQPAKYYSPIREGYSPRQTVRFRVQTVFRGKSEAKEIAVDVMSSSADPAKSFQVGEEYLVYATPRFYLKDEFTIEDHVLLYPNKFTNLVARSSDDIKFLKTVSRRDYLEDFLGESLEGIVRGGTVSGRAVSLVKPIAEGGRQARAKRIDVLVVIDEAGDVVKAKARCGDPILARAAEEAALKSKFTPLRVSGKAVKFSGFIVYNFAND